MNSDIAANFHLIYRLSRSRPKSYEIEYLPRILTDIMGKKIAEKERICIYGDDAGKVFTAIARNINAIDPRSSSRINQCGQSMFDSIFASTAKLNYDNIRSLFSRSIPAPKNLFDENAVEQIIDRYIWSLSDPSDYSIKQIRAIESLDRSERDIYSLLKFFASFYYDLALALNVRGAVNENIRKKDYFDTWVIVPGSKITIGAFFDFYNANRPYHKNRVISFDSRIRPVTKRDALIHQNVQFIERDYIIYERLRNALSDLPDHNAGEIDECFRRWSYSNSKENLFLNRQNPSSRFEPLFAPMTLSECKQFLGFLLKDQRVEVKTIQFDDFGRQKVAPLQFQPLGSMIDLIDNSHVLGNQSGLFGAIDAILLEAAILRENLLFTDVAINTSRRLDMIITTLKEIRDIGLSDARVVQIGCAYTFLGRAVANESDRISDENNLAFRAFLSGLSAFLSQFSAWREYVVQSRSAIFIDDIPINAFRDFLKELSESESAQTDRAKIATNQLVSEAETIETREDKLAIVATAENAITATSKIVIDAIKNEGHELTKETAAQARKAIAKGAVDTVVKHWPKLVNYVSNIDWTKLTF